MYLQAYTNGGGRGQFLFGLPEAFVVLVTFVFVVTGSNAAFGWYYLGKPDLSQLYTPESGTEAPDRVAQSDSTELEGS
ncbi:hypothetical protein ACFQPA_20630 [Halomarina halobia]|uniref:Uncharacterized protein n=1 Tax=Halomarina halobia TaxID=3033386 RepID=A0ABD6AEE0_9EURY|nr:hypothetical protein [Halomarina sp. PSR21]